ncbi:TetR/AcrR family transcriptional regulator [Puniceibacterium sediminis]|uniref:Transcriptional regulator, TetR family n=1 Tax=Puniceibacterium sediminis TaxID=1608407 RepID=A0A238WV42_9RHOB|nr:TetR/AcrR family transcriptional regulator [Puniceibacterium sediminis]SNR50313.1 transcriptional regulator, TetR family [Puniceibacterium sediminis]
MAEKTGGWRGSEDLWLEAAYQLLIEQGVEAVKVMPLAKRVGLSRTSFYGHFDSREALLAALIARWRAKNTGNMIARAEAFSETIAEAVLNLFDCWLRPDLFDSQLDFAIRNWALGDPDLRAVLEATDQERIAAIRAMFLRFGFAEADAQVRAFTVYYTQIGYVSMMVTESPEVRMPRMPFYVQTFTGTSASDSELARFASRHGMTLEAMAVK